MNACSSPKYEMSRAAYDFVVAGAGVCGLATARALVRAVPDARILVVSAHTPMGVTSALSTECFRDHWPSPYMRSFMRRSIDLMREHHDGLCKAGGSGFGIQQRGYLYVSSRTHTHTYMDEARECHGGDNVRVFNTAHSVAGQTSSERRDTHGADVYTSSEAVQAAFPFVSHTLTCGLHARRAGWLNAHTMGMSMLDELRAARRSDGRPAVDVVRGSVEAVDARSGRVASVGINLAAGHGGGGSRGSMTVSTPAFINAAGPWLSDVHTRIRGRSGALPGLPVFSEVHAKVVFRDTLGVIPRSSPMVICDDALRLQWSDDEIDAIRESNPALAARLTATLPAGAHFRPYGGDGSNAVLMLWECWHHDITAPLPPTDDLSGLLDHEWYPEVTLRGLARVVPDLALYFDPAYRSRAGKQPALEARARTAVDGGHYTKTRENLPLIGPAPADGACCESIGGAVVCGAVSGYGIMAAHAAGELAALHATGASKLPDYARWMSPMRYGDAEFMKAGGVRDTILKAGGGQL